MIRDTGANGLIILSGDRHRGEMSKLEGAAPYPLYDITSSALNMSHPIDYVEPNAHRIGKLVNENNFGLMTIDWDKPDPEITNQLRDVKDSVRSEVKIKLRELTSM